MKRFVRFHVAVVLCLALVGSAVPPVVAQEPLSAVCAAALTALDDYYDGLITKAELDAAVALCEAEKQASQGGSGNQGGSAGGGGGGGGSAGGGGGQGPVPQAQNAVGGFGGGGVVPTGGDVTPNLLPGDTTGNTYVYERVFNYWYQWRNYCGDNYSRPRLTDDLEIVTIEGKQRTVRVTHRCTGGQWELIHQWPSGPHWDHIAWETNDDICEPHVSGSYTGTNADLWPRTSGFSRINPNYDPTECEAQRAAAETAAETAAAQAESDRRQANIALWTADNGANRPAGVCEVGPVRDNEEIPIEEVDENTSWGVWLHAPNIQTGDWLRYRIANYGNRQDAIDYWRDPANDCSELYWDRAQ